MQQADVEKKLQSLKPVLADKYNVSKIGYFGSFSSGRQSKGSDLDLMVEFSKPIGWKFLLLKNSWNSNSD